MSLGVFNDPDVATGQSSSWGGASGFTSGGLTLVAGNRSRWQRTLP
jgi:hypothetical protein